MPKLNKTLYKLPHISQQLVDTLDWAWLVDFGQGNFIKAKEKTENALKKEKSTSNFLARAIVHQLQGEYNQALFLLRKTFDIETDPHHKFVIATVTYLVERKMQNNLVDGCSLNSNKTKTDEDWQNKIKFLKLEINNLEYRLIINLIQQIASILPCWRTAILKQNYQGIDTKYQTLIWQKITEQLELYQQKQYQAVADYFYCYFANLLALSGQFVAGWHIVENLASAYKKSANNLETAWYLMSQGDLILETNPFGKPIVFGYQLVANNFNYSNFQLLDRSQIDSISAQQKYLEARQYFVRAFAPRGEAMSIMGLAYINGVQKQWYLASCGYEEAQKIFLELGDNLNAIAAEMGYLWSFLQYEMLENQSLVDLEKSIDWMLENGTISFLISWSMAFTAAATEALSQEEGIYISQRSIEVAEIIVNKAIHTEVFSASNYYDLWTKAILAIDIYYRDLTIKLVLQDDWEQGFITAEKAKIYNTSLFTRSKVSNINIKEQIDKIIPLKEIVQLLPLDTLLISFVVTSERLLGWAITNNGLVKKYLFDKIDREEFKSENLEQTINIWLNSLIDSETDKQSNEILEQIFLKPFIPEIENCKHLLIAKCDRLRKLSFAGLKYNHQAKSNFLKKEVFLVEEKTISYFLSTVRADLYKPINIKVSQVSIYTQNSDNDNFNNLSLSQISLSRSLAVAIAQIYNTNYFETNNQIEISNVQSLINFFTEQNDNLLDNISQINCQKDLVIINIENSNNQNILEKIDSEIKNILEQNIKTLVVIFNKENSLATAMLTLFFHQGLYFGQTVAKSMQLAQKQLRSIGASDALDFCHYLQSHIPWEKNSDRAIRALITKQIGDIMVLGKDYKKAAEAYEVAIYILNDTGYLEQAKSLQENYQMLESLKKISQPFQSQSLIFKAPAYWNNAYIYGNWQLSFTAL